MEIPGAGALRDLHAVVISLRAQLTTANAFEMLGGGGTRRGNKHGGTARNYDTASGGGDRPPGARHGRSIGSGERGSYESTGIRIGERGGTRKSAWSGLGRAIMHNGTEKGFGRIRNSEFRRQGAARDEGRITDIR